ncbi:hypothetical protein [Streptomyces sp. NPDC048496]|uniref:hypothetical protein n=1 Tax=Streptomyces sp. NPDC048496 TaxID=3365558 RepID=UPI003722A809
MSEEQSDQPGKSKDGESGAQSVDPRVGVGIESGLGRIRTCTRRVELLLELSIRQKWYAT